MVERPKNAARPVERLPRTLRRHFNGPQMQLFHRRYLKTTSGKRPPKFFSLEPLLTMDRSGELVEIAPAGRQLQVHCPEFLHLVLEEIRPAVYRFAQQAAYESAGTGLQRRRQRFKASGWDKSAAKKS